METTKTQDVGLMWLVLPGDAGARLVEELERSAAGRLVSRTDEPIPGLLTRAPGDARDVGQYMGVRLAVEPETATVDVWRVYRALILANRAGEVPSYEGVRAMLERAGAG